MKGEIVTDGYGGVYSCTQPKKRRGPATRPIFSLLFDIGSFVLNRTSDLIKDRLLILHRRHHSGHEWRSHGVSVSFQNG